MTLPASGQITLNQVNVELGLTATAQIGLGDANVRTLFNVATGQITMANGYGKANEFAFSITTNSQDLNLATAATSAGWNGTVAVIATVNAGVYVYSDNNTTAGMIISGSWPGGLTVQNNGYIIGKGGTTAYNTGQQGAPAGPLAPGGKAISISSSGVTIINGSGAYIAGGGGAAAAGYQNGGGGAGGGKGGGGGGGAGGGPGQAGAGTSAAYGGGAGAIGAGTGGSGGGGGGALGVGGPGGSSNSAGAAGTGYSDASAGGIGGISSGGLTGPGGADGGGGGRILPGVGGARSGGTGPFSGGEGGSGNAAGGNAGTMGIISPYGYPGAGGGGGWAAIGGRILSQSGTPDGNLGGVGGAAIDASTGYTLTNSGTIWGAT